MWWRLETCALKCDTLDTIPYTLPYACANARTVQDTVYAIFTRSLYEVDFSQKEAPGFQAFFCASVRIFTSDLLANIPFYKII